MASGEKRLVVYPWISVVFFIFLLLLFILIFILFYFLSSLWTSRYLFFSRLGTVHKHLLGGPDEKNISKMLQVPLSDRKQF